MNPSTSISHNETEGSPSFYQGKSEFWATYPTPKEYCTDPKKITDAKNILSVQAPVGATNLCPIWSCIGRDVLTIQTKYIDREFLCFYLKEIESYINSLGAGAIFKAINKSQLSDLPINDMNAESPEH